MEKTWGWTGRLLTLELPSGAVGKRHTLDYADRYVGGRALASRIYWDEVSAGTGALESDNLLLIMSGPLGGTEAIAGSRWVMTAKSPHSYPEQYGFGNGGGFLGASLKRAGWDGLAIRGKAKVPSYLLIENEKVEVRDARGLWGLTAEKTMEKLIALGEDYQPLGERLELGR